MYVWIEHQLFGQKVQFNSDGTVEPSFASVCTAFVK